MCPARRPVPQPGCREDSIPRAERKRDHYVQRNVLRATPQTLLEVETRERRLRLAHHRLHDVAGRPHVADEPGALATRRAAVLDVALLASLDGRRLAHAFELDGEGLDLGLP